MFTFIISSCVTNSPRPIVYAGCPNSTISIPLISSSAETLKPTINLIPYHTAKLAAKTNAPIIPTPHSCVSKDTSG